MILRVRANKPSFREVEFTSGMNVVLAERAEESTSKDSRNGLGKTTLLQIIHFCLGANTRKNKGLIVAPLMDWEFSLDLSFHGRQVTVSRRIDTPKLVAVNGDTEGWPIQPALGLEGMERPAINVSEWRILLGWLAFDLPAGDQQKVFSPSFRSLFPYFVRIERDAFTTPFETFRKQPEWNKQVSNAFLLGLTWEYAQDWQVLKEEDKAILQLQKAPGLLAGISGTIGELNAQRVRLETSIRKRRDQLTSFRVHPQYSEIVSDANQVTQRIHEYVLASQRSERLIDFYEQRHADEKTSSEPEVRRMYESVGLALPRLVERRLEEVAEFHNAVSENRKRFLQTETARLRERVGKDQAHIEELSERRAHLLEVLETHGALEEYSALQNRQNDEQSLLKAINERIESVRRVEQGKRDIRLRTQNLQEKALADYLEHREALGEAIALFNENSERLYEAPGELVVDVTPKGYTFGVEIQREASAGFQQMKVFCYDLMLIQRWGKLESSPEILAHDSAIFADVDERQIAGALQLVPCHA